MGRGEEGDMYFVSSGNDEIEGHCSPLADRGISVGRNIYILTHFSSEVQNKSFDWLVELVELVE